MVRARFSVLVFPLTSLTSISEKHKTFCGAINAKKKKKREKNEEDEPKPLLSNLTKSPPFCVDRFQILKKKTSLSRPHLARPKKPYGSMLKRM